MSTQEEYKNEVDAPLQEEEDLSSLFQTVSIKDTAEEEPIKEDTVKEPKKKLKLNIKLSSLKREISTCSSSISPAVSALPCSLAVTLNPAFKRVIDNNTYVQKCTSNKEKDRDSLSSLIDIDLSQSDRIKLGTGLESVIRDLILDQNTSLTNIKPKNMKGEKEKDHLFMNEDTKTIFYAELKSNLNLDTEKCKSTSNKCQDILKKLKEEYPDYDIQMFLVGLRYIVASDITKVVATKYTCIKENLVGINEYLEALGLEKPFKDEKEYRVFLNYVAKSMFT